MGKQRQNRGHILCVYLCVERLRAQDRNTPGRQRVNTCLSDPTGNYQTGCTMTVYKMDPLSPPTLLNGVAVLVRVG